MEKICDKSKCTGCSACVNSCPQNAINMIKDENGFMQISIDESRCIDCKLCKSICPILNKKNCNSINKCYVGYAMENKYLEHSSSGGIFTVVAEKILLDNGVVIGASFENNKLNHILIKSVEELNKLQGSKYLQSNLGNIFKVVKENIKNKKVLFVGTPCQVAGLKAFLKKSNDNLITIDLFCHGVPSPKLFDKYVEELEKNNNDKLINYDFRDKSTGWDTYSNKAIFRDKEIKQLHNDNDYMNLFLSDVTLRESCYDCCFKLGNKYSDITLGDFWGVKNYYPEMYNKNGVSAVIINTDKGTSIWSDICDKLEYKNCRLEEIINGNPSLVKSAVLTKQRKFFFSDIDNYSIKKLIEKYKKRIPLKLKIISKLRKIKSKIKNA